MKRIVFITAVILPAGCSEPTYASCLVDMQGEMQGCVRKASSANVIQYCVNQYNERARVCDIYLPASVKNAPAWASEDMIARAKRDYWWDDSRVPTIEISCPESVATLCLQNIITGDVY